MLLIGCNFPTRQSLNDELKAFNFCKAKKPKKLNDTRVIGRLIDLDDLVLKPLASQLLQGDKILRLTKYKDQLGHIKSEKEWHRLVDQTEKEVEYLSGYKKKEINEASKVYTTLKIPKDSFIFCGSAYYLFCEGYSTYVHLEAGLKFRKGNDIYEVTPFIVHRDESKCKFKRYGFSDDLIFWEFKKLAQ